MFKLIALNAIVLIAGKSATGMKVLLPICAFAQHQPLAFLAGAFCVLIDCRQKPKRGATVCVRKKVNKGIKTVVIV